LKTKKKRKTGFELKSLPAINIHRSRSEEEEYFGVEKVKKYKGEKKKKDLKQYIITRNIKKRVREKERTQEGKKKKRKTINKEEKEIKKTSGKKVKE